MPTVTLPDGTVLTRTSRADVLARIAAIPLGVIPYNQGKVSPVTDKRSDCTGWVSYCWDTPDSGPGIYLKAYNTASFYTQQVMVPIGWDDLLPGDTIGYFAPTSPGNGGHAAIWMGGDKRPDGTFDVVDHGSGMGPKSRRVKWDGQSTGWMHPSHLAPWRYVAIVEDDGTTYEPGQSLDEEEFMSTADLQRALNDAGAQPKLTVDGSYGPKTHDAFVKALRPAPGPEGPPGPKGDPGEPGPAGTGVTPGDQLTVVVA